MGIVKQKGKKLVKCVYDRISDIMVIFEKDENGKNSERYISKPKYDFYISKPEYYQEHNLDYIEIEKCDKRTVQYSKLLEGIADALDELETKVFGEVETRHNDFLKEARKKKETYKSGNILLTSPNVFGCDMHIEDFYMMQYNNKYDYPLKTTKGFFDIETNMVEGEKNNKLEEPSDCIKNACDPIYLITYRNQYDDYYTLILDDGTVPAATNFVRDSSLMAEYIKNKQAEMPYVKMKFMIFETEIDLIKKFFEIVDKDAPEYMMAWNIEFDINTLINRIIALGYDPYDIFIPADIPVKKFLYYKDYKAKEAADSSSYMHDTSRSKWICQMNTYCKFRKTAAKPIGGYSLDSIAFEEVKSNKVALEDASIKTIAYKNYKMFLDYSIKDTDLLYDIEAKTKDIDMIHIMSILTNTRFFKVQAKSLSMKNQAFLNFLDESGVVMSNNLNTDYGQGLDPTNGFDGAFVADPLLNGYYGVYILGKRSKYLQGANIDFDYSSMYPNNMRSFQIARQNSRGTIVAKLGKEDVTRQYVDMLCCKEYYQLGVSYLGLPGYDNIVKLIEKEMNERGVSNVSSN